MASHAPRMEMATPTPLTRRISRERLVAKSFHSRHNRAVPVRFNVITKGNRETGCDNNDPAQGKVGDGTASLHQCH